MTNKEALTSLIPIQVSVNLIDKILLDRSIDGTINYTAANETEIEIASAFVFKNLALYPNFKEGNLSITNKQAARFLSYANDIFKKNNMPDEMIKTEPKIKFETL